MAIDYSFKLTGASDKQVSHLLTHAATTAGLVDQATSEPSFDGTGDWLDSGVHVGVTAVLPLPFPDPFEEELGFAPVVTVLFSVNSSADVRHQKHDIMRLVSFLLNEIQGDAALLFVGEVVWLLRKGGQLTVSNRDDIWQPDLLALLPQPFERASLPVL